MQESTDRSLVVKELREIAAFIPGNWRVVPDKGEILMLLNPTGKPGSEEYYSEAETLSAGKYYEVIPRDVERTVDEVLKDLAHRAKRENVVILEHFFKNFLMLLSLLFTIFMVVHF